MDTLSAASPPPTARLAAARSLTAIPVIIVGYDNARDIVACLTALSRLREEPAFEVFICENGGARAYDALIAALTTDGGPCSAADGPIIAAASRLRRQCLLELATGGGGGRRVHVGEAEDNLGYAGGINAWLRPLLAVADWPALWILNPDTEPAPDALYELAAYSRQRGKGMVGSRIVPKGQPRRIHSRGLAWRTLRADTLSVDFHAPAAVEPDADDVDARLHSPSGASMYVTRACVEGIGLMEERYFLYFEDLDWGLRAKGPYGVGYAHRSVVVHVGGTTIGSAVVRKTERSPLSTYLIFRNRLLFVRWNSPRWLPWTLLMALVDAARLLAAGQPKGMAIALRGIADGLAGQTGRPHHTVIGDRARRDRRGCS